MDRDHTTSSVSRETFSRTFGQQAETLFGSFYLEDVYVKVDNTAVESFSPSPGDIAVSGGDGHVDHGLNQPGGEVAI